jgi:hypothetical protein
MLVLLPLIMLNIIIALTIMVFVIHFIFTVRNFVCLLDMFLEGKKKLSLCQRRGTRKDEYIINLLYCLLSNT